MISEVERVIHPQYIIYIQLVSRYARSAKHSLTADIPPVGLSEDGDHPSPINLIFFCSFCTAYGVYSTKVSRSCTPDSWEQKHMGSSGCWSGIWTCANIIDTEAMEGSPVFRYTNVKKLDKYVLDF